MNEQFSTLKPCANKHVWIFDDGKQLPVFIPMSKMDAQSNTTWDVPNVQTFKH